MSCATMVSCSGKFRSKVVEIEAHPYDGTSESQQAIVEWTKGTETFAHVTIAGRLVIHTLEGAMFANPGDWIIRGTRGEHYPCKPDVFAAKYEAVGE